MSVEILLTTYYMIPITAGHLSGQFSSIMGPLSRSSIEVYINSGWRTQNKSMRMDRSTSCARAARAARLGKSARQPYVPESLHWTLPKEATGAARAVQMRTRVAQVHQAAGHMELDLPDGGGAHVCTPPRSPLPKLLTNDILHHLNGCVFHELVETVIIYSHVSFLPVETTRKRPANRKGKATIGSFPKNPQVCEKRTPRELPIPGSTQSRNCKPTTTNLELDLL